MDNFVLLNKNEEEKLSYDEKIEYYKKLREEIKKRNYTNLTPGAITIGPKLKNFTNKIAKKVVKLFSGEKVEVICEGKENIPDGPVIFAHTHQGVLDGFVWIPELDRHCFVLHGGDVNKLLLLCQYNTGLVLTKKSLSTDSEEYKQKVKSFNSNAKLDMIKLLMEGHSLSYFPEGTWNLSPNKLHLPLNYGFLDVARKAGVPIIPVVHEFTYANTEKKEIITRIHSKYGTPIKIDLTDDILKKLDEYDEQISTMRYELIEEKGLFKRKDITSEEYINFLKGNYKNLRMGHLNLQKEKENIFGSKDEFYDFHHINDVPFNDDGELLETEEKRRLDDLNKKHGI